MADGAKSDHPGVQAQLDRLSLLSPGRDVLGLGRISALMERLGNPHRTLPPVFHVAGTNGKGSTCAFLRAAIEAAGLTAHVYTSPHLVRFNERIRVAGRLIEDQALAPLLAEVLDASEDIASSFFEATTAAAFLAFSRTPADAAIIEVGLGGRLDATNVIERPVACGIAQLGIDHHAFLLSPEVGTPESPEARIAFEKAGIAKKGVPLVTMRYSEEVAATVEDCAKRAGAGWLPEGRDWHISQVDDGVRYRDSRGSLALPRPTMPGDHQVQNAGLAIAMLRHQNAIQVDDDALAKAMQDTRWPGRLQRLAPGPLTGNREVWLDGAHNEAAGASIAEFMRTLPRPIHLVTGVLANKDARGLLSHFQGVADTLTAIPVPGHACHSPVDLAEIGRSLGIDSDTAHGPTDAIRRSDAPTTFFLVSLYLAGEVLKANNQIPE